MGGNKSSCLVVYNDLRYSRTCWKRTLKFAAPCATMKHPASLIAKAELLLAGHAQFCAVEPRHAHIPDSNNVCFLLQEGQNDGQSPRQSCARLV